MQPRTALALALFLLCVVPVSAQDVPVHEAGLEQLERIAGGGGHQTAPHHHLAKVQAKANKCGGWQQEYTKLHQEALVRGLSPRSSQVLIFKSPNSGLADRLAGLITGFYAAVLSQRAFFLTDWWTWGGVHVRLSDALEMQHINWTLPQAWEQRLQHGDNQSYTLLDYINTEPLFAPEGEPNRTRADTELIMSAAAGAVVNSSASTSAGARASATIVFQSNRGNVYRLLKHPPALLAAAAGRLGVAPEFGVYCAFHYLFRLRPEVLELTRPLLPSLHTARGVVRVGIHIRVGDRGFSFGTQTEVDSDPYLGKFFECAADIERRLAPQLFATMPHAGQGSSPKVLWYLISDSLSLKESAARKYGDKLVWTKHKPMHIGISNNVNDIEGPRGSEAVQLAVADVTSLALCDYFVLSHDSGLGKLSALLSHNAHDGRVFVTSHSGCKPYSDEDMARANQGA